MEPKVEAKPEVITLDSSLNSSLMKEAATYPEWLKQFSRECTKVYGTRCSEKLEKLMDEYIKHVKKEILLCTKSPNRAALIASRMYRTMFFFYLYYLDVKEFFVTQLWIERVTELLVMYCQIEMRASFRLQRGKETDSMICTRFMSAFWVYLGGSTEHILNLLMRIPGYARRNKEMFDPIFKKLLVTNKPNRVLTDIEYIRNLLAFKVWKRFYVRHEKKYISNLAVAELKPPQSFINNTRKYRFLPCYAGKSDITGFLVTALFDVDSTIKDFFAYIDRKRIRNLESDFRETDNISFISELSASLSTHCDNIEELSNNINDTYILDDIKVEVDVKSDEDDLIIIDPEPDVPAVLHNAPIISNIVIDLTEDEPDYVPSVESSNFVPSWCMELLNTSKECQPEISTDICMVDVQKSEIMEEICTETRELCVSNIRTSPETVCRTPSPEPAWNSKPCTSFDSRSESPQNIEQPQCSPLSHEEAMEVKSSEATSESHSWEPVINDTNNLESKSSPTEGKIDEVENTVRNTSPPDINEEPNSSQETLHNNCEEYQEILHETEPINAEVVTHSEITWEEKPIKINQQIKTQQLQDFEHVKSPATTDQIISEPEKHSQIDDTVQETDVPTSELDIPHAESTHQEQITYEESSERHFSPNRKALCITPLEIMDDSSCFEECTGIREISSTSQETISSKQIIAQENFDTMVDSTSNIVEENEMDIEEPNVIPYIIEQDIEARDLGQLEEEFCSPEVEPMNDFARYLSNFNPESASAEISDLIVNKKRKNGENVMRYNSKRRQNHQSEPILENHLSTSGMLTNEKSRERPAEVKKNVRFDLWDSLLGKTFKLTSKEIKLTQPYILGTKEKTDFNKKEDLVPHFGLEPVRDLIIEPSKISKEVLSYTGSKQKTILERQDYVKSANNYLARVETRPEPIVPPPLPDVVVQTKKGPKRKTQPVTKRTHTKKRKPQH